MARPLRIEYPGAVYHITSRGNERHAIIVDDRDRAKWLDLLAHTVAACRWRMLAFALMDNHFHLFLQTPEANLSAGMRYLNGAYATWFNVRHERSGHLLQGRFKALLVDSEGYWLEVSRYVHLNPVRAGLVQRPEQWRWSSYPGYHRAARRLAWVDYETVLGEFGGENPRGRQAYRRFIEQGLQRKLDSPLSAAVHGVVLGSEEFLQRVQQRLQGHRADPEIPDLARLAQGTRPEMEHVIKAVAEQFGCDPTRWRSGQRCDDLGRAVAAFAGRQLTGVSAQIIAESLGYRSVSSVTVACRRVRRAMEDRRVAKRVRQLMRSLATNH